MTEAKPTNPRRYQHCNNRNDVINQSKHVSWDKLELFGTTPHSPTYSTHLYISMHTTRLNFITETCPALSKKIFSILNEEQCCDDSVCLGFCITIAPAIKKKTKSSLRQSLKMSVWALHPEDYVDSMLRSNKEWSTPRDWKAWREFWGCAKCLVEYPRSLLKLVPFIALRAELVVRRWHWWEFYSTQDQWWCVKYFTPFELQGRRGQEIVAGTGTWIGQCATMQQKGCRVQWTR